MIDLSNAESQVQCVSSFAELVGTSYHGKMNAICWNRELKGDFSEIINKIKLTENMVTIAPEELSELELSKQGHIAREILLADFKALKEHGASPTLNLINYYERDDSFPFFPVDVYSYHVDRSPIPTDTFLCTYHGEPSDILPNSKVKQKILIPEIRAELKKIHGKEEGFEEFLSEFFFDLHFQAESDAIPVNLGIGHLWKLAVDHPESEVLPCVHRAPVENEGETRLLLIC